MYILPPYINHECDNAVCGHEDQIDDSNTEEYGEVILMRITIIIIMTAALVLIIGFLVLIHECIENGRVDDGYQNVRYQRAAHC